MKPLIVGLHGAPRSGKTTISQILSKKHGFRHESISESIKDMAHGSIGKTYGDEEKDVPKEELGGKTPRELYIAFGNVDDTIHPVWVRQTYLKIKTHRFMAPIFDSFVIESIGKQFQWDWLIENAQEEYNLALIEVVREGYTYEAYRDSRSRIAAKGTFSSFITNLSKPNENTMALLESRVSVLVDVLKRKFDERQTPQV